MLSNQLTIVIPCKNESINIYDCLRFIYKQKFIDGVLVIIADSSDDIESLNWLHKCTVDFSDKLRVQIITGGFPAEARLEGSKQVITPYVLFLDADILLKEKGILIKAYRHIFAFQKHLLTVPFKTERGWNWAFRLFDIVQRICWAMGTPFAIGGFQLWNTQEYWNVGGYVKTQKFAEDYWISSKCSKDKFLILKASNVWTSARRFRKKGIQYIISIMIKSYINRNNSEFFEEDHNYWK